MAKELGPVDPYKIVKQVLPVLGRIDIIGIFQMGAVNTKQRSRGRLSMGRKRRCQILSVLVWLIIASLGGRRQGRKFVIYSDQ